MSPGVTVANVKTLVVLVHDRVMCVLAFVAGLAVFESRNPGAANQFRLLRILEIENLDDDISEAALT